MARAVRGSGARGSGADQLGTAQERRGPRREFTGTRWTLVREAGAGSAAALEWLCRAYWEPVCAFIRARGYSADAAAEQTQEFFAKQILPLHKAALLGQVDANRRFRAWLLGAVKHHLAHHREAVSAIKRNESTTSSIEEEVAPGHELTPERAFHRRWALQMLERALERLEQGDRERAPQRPAGLFDALRPLLVGPEGEQPEYAELARRFGKKPNAIAVEVHRLRRRLGDILYSEIAETLAEPTDADDELRFLLQALSPPPASSSIWAQRDA